MKLFRDVPRKDLVFYLELSLVYLIIAAAMLWPVTTDIAGRVLGGGGDPYQAMWDLWWVSYATFTLHSSIYFTNLLFYPIGATLITQTMSPFIGILASPLQAVSLAFEMNVVTLVAFMLSGLFMYFLAHRITKNAYASFIAGFIFTFSAIHFTESGGHLLYINIEFIPLFLLLFFDMMHERKVRNMVYAAIAFLFITFAGDLTQALMAVMLIVIILLYTLATDRKTVLNLRFAGLAVGMVVLIFVLGSWAFIPMINGIRSGVLSVVNAQASTQYNEIYSLDLASYFLPSFTNGLFTGIVPSYYAIFAPDPGERAAYAGYTVIALVLIALVADYKETRFKHTGLWLIILVFFAWMTLGPYLQVLGNLSVIPGIYALYHLIPVFNVIREPSRFDFMVTIALAILAAIGFDKASHSKYVKDKRLLFGAVVFLLFIEYWGAPLSTSSPYYYVDNASIPKAFSQIANISGNYSILLLPALQNTTLPEHYPGLEEYYQTADHKPLVGGYPTRTNLTQTESVAVIPLAGQALYLERGYGFLYPYPIIENYSNVTNLWLALDNVRFVGVVRQAYNASEQESILSYLYGLYGQPVYQDNSTTIFDVSSKLQANAGKSLVAYYIGTWLPGLSLCPSLSECNETFANTWWGSNPRYFNVYSPSARKLNMTLQAWGPTDTNMYVYLNDVPVDILPVTTSPKNFSVPLNISAGYSQVGFVVSNSTLAGVNQYEYFGLSGIRLG